MGEVLVLEAEALVVLVAEAAEELGEGELDALRFAIVPGGGAEEVVVVRPDRSRKDVG